MPVEAHQATADHHGKSGASGGGRRGGTLPVHRGHLGPKACRDGVHEPAVRKVDRAAPDPDKEADPDGAAEAATEYSDVPEPAQAWAGAAVAADQASPQDPDEAVPSVEPSVDRPEGVLDPAEHTQEPAREEPPSGDAAELPAEVRRGMWHALSQVPQVAGQEPPELLKSDGVAAQSAHQDALGLVAWASVVQRAAKADAGPKGSGPDAPGLPESASPEGASGDQVLQKRAVPTVLPQAVSPAPWALQVSRLPACFRQVLLPRASPQKKPSPAPSPLRASLP